MPESFHIESASVSDRGLNEARPQNEDSFLEIPHSGIFAVADGVGGAQAGEVASQMAMEILGEAFINYAPGSDAEVVMRVALERANSAIHQMSTELPQLTSMATTVVALHLAGNIATIGHAGDSRLYRLDAEGRLHRETDDHSMVAEEVRAGRMTEEQAENHPGKNIISRALGAEPTVQLDLKTMMVGASNTFLICSDGVTRHISDAEIADLLRSTDTPAVICERIKSICFERGAEDNLTAVIVRLAADNDEQVVEAPAATAEPTELEEVTVAAARGPFDYKVSEDEDDELLELDSPDLMEPTEASHEPDLFAVNKSSIPAATSTEEEHAQIEPKSLAYDEPQIDEMLLSEYSDEVEHPTETNEFETTESIPFEVAEPETRAAAVVVEMPQAAAEHFSMFGNTGADLTVTEDRPGSASKMFTWVGLLLLGAVIGLGAYHFLLANRNAQVTVPPISEMRSSNEPRSAFEDNRRTLDKDPEAALRRYAVDPRDAEDYFLLGRAYLLTGKYPEARKAFMESRNHIAAGDVDPSNAKTLQNEIAIAMAVTNDTTIQTNLKKELDESNASTVPPANSSSNR